MFFACFLTARNAVTRLGRACLLRRPAVERDVTVMWKSSVQAAATAEPTQHGDTTRDDQFFGYFTVCQLYLLAIYLTMPQKLRLRDVQ